VTAFAQGARITTKHGPITGEILSYVVVKASESQEITYTLVRGDRITAIDQAGVHCDQPPPERRATRNGAGEPASVKVVRIRSGGDQVTTEREKALLKAVASDDFRELMNGLMTFKVETGSGVDQSDEFETRVVSGRLYGTVDSVSGLVTSVIRIRTSAGEQSINVGDVVPFRQP
jgi:hypothetical protein